MHARNPLAVARLFNGPAWRRIAARQAADAVPSDGAAPSDGLIRRTASYFQLCDQSPESARLAAHRFPAIHAAEQLWQNVAARELFQQLVLAGFERQEIGERLGLDERVVEVSEKLLFDVKDQLDAAVWIVVTVIKPASDAGQHALAVGLRVAYFGGRHALQALLDARSGLPIGPAEQLAQASVVLASKVAEAASIPLDGRGTVEVMRLAADVQLKQERIALEREKLHHRMERWAARQGRGPVESRNGKDSERHSVDSAAAVEPEGAGVDPATPDDAQQVSVRRGKAAA